jgi:hypothetical protein
LDGGSCKRPNTARLLTSLKKKRAIDFLFLLSRADSGATLSTRPASRKNCSVRLLEMTGGIRAITSKAGYRWRKARKVLTSTDPKYREKVHHIQSLAELQENEAFFSIDEYGPFSIRAQGGRALAGPGEMPTVPQYQKSKGCLIMTTALELSKNQISYF